MRIQLRVYIFISDKEYSDFALTKFIYIQVHRMSSDTLRYQGGIKAR